MRPTATEMILPSLGNVYASKQPLQETLARNDSSKFENCDCHNVYTSKQPLQETFASYRRSQAATKSFQIVILEESMSLHSHVVDRVNPAEFKRNLWHVS